MKAYRVNQLSDNKYTLSVDHGKGFTVTENNEGRGFTLEEITAKTSSLKAQGYVSASS